MLAEGGRQERWERPSGTRAVGSSPTSPSVVAWPPLASPQNSPGSPSLQSHPPLTTGSFWDFPREGEWGAHPVPGAVGGIGRELSPASGRKLPDRPAWVHQARNGQCRVCVWGVYMCVPCTRTRVRVCARGCAGSSVWLCLCVPMCTCALCPWCQ